MTTTTEATAAESDGEESIVGGPNDYVTLNNGSRRIARPRAKIPGYVWERMPIPSPRRLVVLPHEPEEKSRGGIILPTEARDYEAALNYKGRVVAIGSHCWRSPDFGLIEADNHGQPKKVWRDWCEMGEWIIFANHAGKKLPIKHDGREYTFRIVNDRDVLGIVDDPDALMVYIR